MKKVFFLGIVMFFMIGVNNAFSLDNIPKSFSKYNLINYQEGGELYLAPNIVPKKSVGKNEFAGFDVVSFIIKNKMYSILFDPGPSEDPSFMVYILKNRKWKEIGVTSGYRLFISPSGSVYSEGVNNNFFNVRRKYQLTDTKLEEIKQSFLLVDYDCKTSSSVKPKLSDS